jgi:glycosyltransferase involved in cell wall biosynthesis
VPIVAYAAAGVPGTLGGAGLAVDAKDFPTLAELIHRVVAEPALRDAIVAGQRARLRAFDGQAIGAQLRGHLASLESAA